MAVERSEQTHDDDPVAEGMRLVNEVMADDDLQDPLLESYQAYRDDSAAR